MSERYCKAPHANLTGCYNFESINSRTRRRSSLLLTMKLLLHKATWQKQSQSVIDDTPDRLLITEYWVIESLWVESRGFTLKTSLPDDNVSVSFRQRERETLLIKTLSFDFVIIATLISEKNFVISRRRMCAGLTKSEAKQNFFLFSLDSRAEIYFQLIDSRPWQ